MSTANDKKLSGTYRRDRDEKPNANEFFPELEKIGRPPSYFNDDQKKAFHSIAKILFETGLLKKVDVFAIEQMAITRYLFQEAVERLNTHGFTNMHGQVSAAYTVMQNCMKQWDSFSRRFGLSVSDRKRLQGDLGSKDPQQTDLFGDFVEGKLKVVGE